MCWFAVYNIYHKQYRHIDVFHPWALDSNLQTSSVYSYSSISFTVSPPRQPLVHVLASKIVPSLAAFLAAMELGRFALLLLALAVALPYISQALVLTVQNTECVWEDVEYDGDLITGNFVVLDHEIFWGADHPGIELVVRAKLTDFSLYTLPCMLMLRFLFLCLGLAFGVIGFAARGFF